MRAVALVVLALWAPSTAYVFRAPSSASANVGGSGSTDVSSGIAGLATTLLTAFPGQDNVVLSPLGIATVLSALQVGAKGPTAHQLAALLGQGSTSYRTYWVQLGDTLRAINSSTTVISNVATAIFLDKSLALNPRYAQDVRGALASDVFALDIAGQPGQAAAFVNQWVSDRTRGQIRSVVPPALQANSGLLAASALYFNAAWRHQFPVSSTHRARFTVSDTEAFEVDMMEHESDVLYVHDTTLKCQVLGLPYKDESFAMFLLLPDERGVQGLSRLESQLPPETLLRLLASARPTELPYLVPRMRLEGFSSLAGALSAAGVSSIFDPQQADLSGIVYKNTGTPLYVGDLLHRVVVDVSESGTEAASATVALVTLSGRVEEFRADRPFLLVIQHRPTGVILFWASVVRPTPNYPLSRRQ
ncbi:leukocyte elastase inhibitor-like [Schistocerca americana]|uniref:leukocyte elastase inhibitor-like n=1 Tax=Schistocerca americana TaxID=7009 RepID=UPI001F4F9343|nr:leukocyte elastase inhibitor-like [Schistocerca americana]